MFDAKNSSAGEIKVAQIEDRKIAKVHANLSDSRIYFKAEVEYEDGSKSAFYENRNVSCGYVRDIPDG